MCLLDRGNANDNPRDTLIGNLPIGAEVTARVLDIDFIALRVILTSRSSDLQKGLHYEDEYFGQNDPYYRVPSYEETQEAEAAKRVRILLLSVLCMAQVQSLLHDCFVFRILYCICSCCLQSHSVGMNVEGRACEGCRRA